MWQEKIATGVLAAVLAALGYWLWSNASDGDQIAECMARRGDIHSQQFYAECVAELDAPPRYID